MENIIEEDLPEGISVSGIEISETRTLKKRAFAELLNNGVIENLDYTEKTIEYKLDNGDRIGICRYAIFEEKAYLSWVWVKDYFQNNGLGTKLVEKSTEHMESMGVNVVYTIPKSDTAVYMFRKLGFEDQDELDGFFTK